jgi:hypothetical protein
MIITNAQYTKDYDTNENLSIACVIDGQECNVPLVPGNRHYDEIMRQVDAGELTIQAAEIGASV